MADVVYALNSPSSDPLPSAVAASRARARGGCGRARPRRPLPPSLPLREPHPLRPLPLHSRERPLLSSHSPSRLLRLTSLSDTIADSDAALPSSS